MKDLQITASPTSSENDFDFMIGSWKIRNRKLKTRLNNCDEWTEFEARQDFNKILEGFGNIDFFKTDFDGKLFEGMSLRLFDPITRLWSIYWADSNAVTLQVRQIGSFENKIGEFYARDYFEGKPIIVKFKWDATNVEVPIWSQVFSDYEGKTWEWNWSMTFQREV